MNTQMTRQRFPGFLSIWNKTFGGITTNPALPLRGGLVRRRVYLSCFLFIGIW